MYFESNDVSNSNCQSEDRHKSAEERYYYYECNETNDDAKITTLLSHYLRFASTDGHQRRLELAPYIMGCCWCCRRLHPYLYHVVVAARWCFATTHYHLSIESTAGLLPCQLPTDAMAVPWCYCLLFISLLAACPLAIRGKSASGAPDPYFLSGSLSARSSSTKSYGLSRNRRNWHVMMWQPWESWHLR